MGVVVSQTERYLLLAFKFSAEGKNSDAARMHSKTAHEFIKDGNTTMAVAGFQSAVQLSISSADLKSIYRYSEEAIGSLLSHHREGESVNIEFFYGARMASGEMLGLRGMDLVRAEAIVETIPLSGALRKEIACVDALAETKRSGPVPKSLKVEELTPSDCEKYAEIKIKEGRYGDAAKLFRAGIRKITSQDDSIYLIRVSHKLIDLLEAAAMQARTKGNYNQSMENYKEAFTYAEAINDCDAMNRIRREMAEA